MAAIMAAAGRHFYAAALGADDVAEYVALDGRGRDGEGGLQDEHERREKRDADPPFSCRMFCLTLIGETYHAGSPAQTAGRLLRQDAVALSMIPKSGNRFSEKIIRPG